ncbi:GntR family transcriptional regulator [Bauldia sp.]|uniref:GntR family transcriptional regulator n=1 Tax=Bauldia sp. TaxID=2575872 RepID=UPI003BAA3217
MLDERVSAVTGSTRRGLSKVAVVYEELRNAIVQLELAPGARIDKPALCARLGVSRQPLAEAVARLADERLVKIEPQKGTFVTRIRMGDVAEANFVRRSLETATVEAIAPEADADLVQQLKRIVDRQEAALTADDIDEFYRLDLRFHRALQDALAMPRVAETIETARAQLERVRRLLLPYARRATDTVAEHQTIIAALAVHDPEAAKAAMAAHLDTGIAELRDFASRRPELFEA